ncbi:type II secretion system protein [Variovorax sp. PAMC28562]|uniref:PulJ/GspJ family protein n=1 Tax=Variovorax sp. PAMC28562 TaxID=2762323 RepID=UPI00164D45D4|nr:type II secretion system protein [Variovorax sp. PAMC28562]QNK72220.1 type II secretion system protein [Variovorax sp. PAMC28562]
MSSRARHGGGFTLIELTMVIVLMGVIGATVAVFVKGPIDAYFASARRAALTDVADTTLRRMGRDLHNALPNSIRTPSTTPAGQCLEFIPTKTGGRYRADTDAAGNGDKLDFSTPDTSFNMLGSNAALPVDQRIVAGDVIAVYNLGIAGADAYQESNTAMVTAVTGESAAPVETGIAISAKQFPLESASKRFQVIPAAEKVVAYVCRDGNVYRTASTTFSSSCPTTGAILARHVSACQFFYSGSNQERNALARVVIEFTDHGETVSLLDDIHVSNTP